MLRDLADTLKSLMYVDLNDPNSTEKLINEQNIIFKSPADIDSENPNGGTIPTQLSIFLYQIVQNSFLRNSEWEPVGLDKMQNPPLALDLYYLFTPYASDKDTEFILLEKIMTCFYDNAVLKGSILKGSLPTTGNDEIRIVPHSFSFDEINKLWERFPNKPFKLSLAYLISPVRIPSDKTESITRVTERIIDFNRIGDQK
ncbi:MAG TPA: DUF4255 domain-containing protein [Bacillota bacterium]|nr:DUF4255 domain-containing protein [Bacillota bacterium]